MISSPPSCDALSGKVERLHRSLYGLNQASRTWHYHLVRGIKPLGFEQCEADVCVIRSVEDGAVDKPVYSRGKCQILGGELSMT